MDEKTRQNLENYRAKEKLCDEEINMLQELWGDKLNLLWLDILTFGWNAGYNKLAKRRCKEIFIKETYEKTLEHIKI